MSALRLTWKSFVSRKTNQGSRAWDCLWIWWTHRIRETNLPRRSEKLSTNIRANAKILQLGIFISRRWIILNSNSILMFQVQRSLGWWPVCSRSREDCVKFRRLQAQRNFLHGWRRFFKDQSWSRIEETPPGCSRESGASQWLNFWLKYNNKVS